MCVCVRERGLCQAGEDIEYFSSYLSSVFLLLAFDSDSDFDSDFLSRNNITESPSHPLSILLITVLRYLTYIHILYYSTFFKTRLF